MVHPRFLVRLFAGFSIVLTVVLAFSVFAISGASAHTASGSRATPREFLFHHNFSTAELAASSLKSFSASFTAEGKTWHYTMVGTNPSKGSATTTVPVTIIPLKIVFSNGKSFDGTSRVTQTTGSPLFKNASFISGTTQYGDAVARAEFWNFVSTTAKNYHVLLGTPTVASTITMTIPKADGATATDPDTGKTLGLININYFDPQIQAKLTSFSPNMLPIFLSYDVFLTNGAPTLSNCCIGGYHSAVTNSNGLQTYAYSTETETGVVGGFSEDVAALSHEALEWFNDPFVNNVVPNWESPIAPQYGCNNFLEVGDPLVGVVFTVSGFSGDHLQDVALFNWFARQSPSKAINHLYTFRNTFNTLSTMC